MSGDTGSPHIMLVAGEPSGDLLGGQIMGALRDLTDGKVKISGVGGDTMIAQGLESLFSITDTSLMGISEVLPKIPVLLRRIREAVDHAIKTRPDAVVLIDAPDFTHRVAKQLKRRAPEITIIKYVAPQVWAARPKRAETMARIMDHLLVLLPFEPKFFEAHGLDTRFVGHPVVERVEQGDGAAFRNRHGISAEAKLLAVLPGSRRGEIKLMLPVFRDTCARLVKDVPDLQTTIVTMDQVADVIKAATKNWPTSITLVESSEKLDAFASVDAALAASGTVTTELALAKVPMVVGYRLSGFTYAIYRWLINVPYMTLINLIKKSGVVPEFAQGDCTAGNLAEEASRLLKDPEVAMRQVKGCQSALEDMGLGSTPPSTRAAQAILDIVAEKNTRLLA